MNKKVIPLFLAVALTLMSPTQKPEFSDKVYGNVANYFENENDLLRFFTFHKGDVVAEVGAGDGKNIGGFSILTHDSIDFYVQDIDKTRLTQKKFGKIILQAEEYKKPLGHTYHLCIGTEKSTALPDGIFDKLLLISTLHEFTYMDEMMADIHRKLKPDGQLYILEAHCQTKGHKNYTLNETRTILEKNGFSHLKNETANLNNGTGMYRAVFKKVNPE